MAEPLLSMENVTMQFGGVVAVNNLSLSVFPGEIVALIGPNGAGKTTAFNVVTGVYTPTNGKVTYNGHIIAQGTPGGKMKKLYVGENRGMYPSQVVRTPDQITKLGIARTFQNIRLFKSLTVFDNVLIAKHMRMKANLFSSVFCINRAEDKKMREETMELLKTVGLEDVKNEASSSLPYGRQRRLEIARAMATTPQLLLLDEPAAGMNPQETEDLAEFITDIRNRFHLTIFMIEHHMNLVMDISDRIYVIDFGRLIAKGTPAQVQDDPEVIRAYLGVEEA